MRAFGRADELVIGRAAALHNVEHGSGQARQNFFVGVDGGLRFNERDVEAIVAALLIQQGDGLWDVFNAVERAGDILEMTERVSIAEQIWCSPRGRPAGILTLTVRCRRSP